MFSAIALAFALVLLPGLCRALSSSSSSSTPLGDKPARRPRYKGLYPKQFKEKYKELRGDDDVVSKVINKGSTPAGSHISIMVNETLACLGLKDPLGHISVSAAGYTPRSVEEEGENSSGSSVDEQLMLYPPYAERRGAGPSVFVDCTLGFGGHSAAVLGLLPPGSALYGIDQDPQELPRATSRLTGAAVSGGNNTSFVGVLDNFSNLLNITRELGVIGQVAGLMADLGFSSMQVDDPQRGFSRKFDGPLDMRMNAKNSSIETAAQLLSRLGAKDLQRIIEVNSDERFARQIALAIKAAPGGGVQTTFQLVQCVERALTAALVTEKSEVDGTVARVMQSLRIAVNDEFGALDGLLAALPVVLCSGGRAVVLTFHSGEDRRVKKEFQRLHREGVLAAWGRNVIRAGPQERRSNPRSKCCKLRWCVRK